MSCETPRLRAAWSTSRCAQSTRHGRGSSSCGACETAPLKGASRVDTSRCCRLQNVIVVDDQRRVIGKAPVLIDRGGARRGSDARRGNLIVDPPADILGPRLTAIRPPGVLLGLLIQLPEHIDESELVEYACEPAALL